jgi:hypothetical protein
LKQKNYLFKNSKIDTYNNAKEVIPVLLNLFDKPKSVVDLGGGMGGWCKVFEEYGINNVVCIDHPSIPMDGLLIAKEKFIPCDFERDNPPIIKSDLAISIEFAEHVKERHSNRIVKYLTSCSKIILFSAAVPGQGGLGHINEQWPTFWADKFLSESYHYLDILRPHLIENNLISYYLRQNLFLVVKEEFVNKIKLSHSFNFNINEWTLIHRNILEKRGFKNKIKNMLPDKFKGQLEVWNYRRKKIL